MNLTNVTQFTTHNHIRKNTEQRKNWRKKQTVFFRPMEQLYFDPLSVMHLNIDHLAFLDHTCFFT